MKKCHKIIGLICWCVGVLAFTFSLFLGDRLPDFWSGYLLGTALAGMITGIIYILCCIRKKENPFAVK